MSTLEKRERGQAMRSIDLSGIKVEIVTPDLDGLFKELSSEPALQEAFAAAGGTSALEGACIDEFIKRCEFRALTPAPADQR